MYDHYVMWEKDMGGMLQGPMEAPERKGHHPSLKLQIDGGVVASAHSSITHFIWVLEERKRENRIKGIKTSKIIRVWGGWSVGAEALSLPPPALALSSCW